MSEVKIEVTKFFKNNGADDGSMRMRIIKEPGKRTGYYLVFKNTPVMKRFLKLVIDKVIK